MRSPFTLTAGIVFASLASIAAASPPTSEPRLLSEPLATYREARMAGGPGKDGIPSIDEPEFQ